MISNRDISRAEAWKIIRQECRDDEKERRISDHVARSERFVGTFYDDVPLGVFGTARASLLAEEGYVWFQSAPGLADHPRAFARASRAIPAKLLADYTVLYGVCVAARSMRWLRWGGAEFLGTSADGDIFVFRRPHG